MNKRHLSPIAQADLLDIKDYITMELENPQAALSTVNKITTTMRLLRHQALLGAPLSSIAQAESDVRFLKSGNYLIFYRASGSDVFIDRVLYARRDYLRILLNQQPQDDM